MYSALEKRSDINRSDICRKALSDILYPVKEKMGTTTFLNILFGFVFGVALVSGSSFPFIAFEMRTIFLMLGVGTLAVVLLTFIKEVKNGRKPAV